MHMCTKSIYLEIVNNLSAAAFITTLKDSVKGETK